MLLKTFARRAVANLLLLWPSKLSGASVLMYHSVHPSGPGFITDSVAGFEMHLHFIKKQGLRAVFASELPDLMSGSIQDTVCITLDDGYRDNYEYAFPLLKKYGLKATIFLSTGLLDGARTGSNGVTRAMLTREQVKEMLASGIIEFLPHTHTHPHLPTLETEAARAEIAESKRIVEELTGVPSKVFAYPYGEYDAQIRKMVRDLGFTAALGVQSGVIRTHSDPFDLPRNALGDVSEAELAVKLSDRLDAYRIISNPKLLFGL